VSGLDGDLGGRVALVTGGASGIGRATVERLVAAGASVVVADLDGPTAARLVAGLPDDAAGRARSVEADVTDPAAVDAAVATAVDELGGLHLAVNSAGTAGTFAALPDQRLEAWERTLAVNLTGTFLCLQRELPAIVASGGGAVVNVSSAAGLMGFANLPAYVASKHGVIGLTKSVALEYARAGVRVNAVCPASIRTPMLEGFAGGDEQVLEGMGRGQPVGRLGTPEEVAAAIVWLCSDAASFVTGHAMAVDGGVLAT
jgi:NAD(P)-dependent dehydrogenase (short-subunit alcohol dehydrogenase family)